MTWAVTTSGVGVEQGDGADLASRIAAGEPGAFELLVALYQSRVTRLAYRLLGWSGEVEDVVQDVFFTALGKAGSFRGHASLWTWLTVLTVNRCRTHQRRQMVRRRVHRVLLNATPSQNTAADRGAMDHEVAREVRSAVAALPPRDREVIVLFYLEQKTIAEIGRLLNASPNAIEVRMHRARAKLRELLKAFVQE